jgi:hypothetical protein
MGHGDWRNLDCLDGAPRWAVPQRVPQPGFAVFRDPGVFDIFAPKSCEEAFRFEIIGR